MARATVTMTVVGCLSAALLAVSAPATPIAAADRSAPGAAEASAQTSTAGQARIRWRRCAGRQLRRAGLQCGTVRVPLDYSRPNGRSITIAVSRLRHTVPRRQYQGVMLVNPGGPGASGLSLAAVGRDMPARTGGLYDWIGFDPRGVGASRPALSCRPFYFHPLRPSYVPVNGQIRDAWLARAQSYADGCAAAAPALLAHMKTVDMARDLNRIRIALGQRRINYYGYSYGTYLGQVFATLFPARVRRMVLDANVNPTRVWYQANLDQAPAFERVIQRWFAWIADHHRVYRLGRTRFSVQRLFYRTEQSLTRRPAGGVVGPAEWDDAFLVPAYARVAWPAYARAFAAWVRDRRPGPVVRAYRSFDTPGDDNLFAVYNAVICTDASWPQAWRRWAHDNWRLHRVAPFLTWGNVWFNAACRVWPVPAGRPLPVDGHRVPALLLSETADAATPFRGSLVVRSRFPRAALVATRGGTTHAASPTLSPRCVNRRIAAYLRSGDLPRRLPGRRADVVCRPLPAPDPRPRTSTQLAPHLAPPGLQPALRMAQVADGAAAAP